MGSKLNTDTVYLTETFTEKCDLAILIFLQIYGKCKGYHNFLKN